MHANTTIFRSNATIVHLQLISFIQMQLHFIQTYNFSFKLNYNTLKFNHIAFNVKQWCLHKNFG